MLVTVSRRVLGSEGFQILLMLGCDETRLLTAAHGDVDSAQKWNQELRTDTQRYLFTWLTIKGHNTRPCLHPWEFSGPE